MYQLAPHARHTDALQVWALVYFGVTAESHHQLHYYVFIIERIKVLRPSLTCETCKTTLKKVFIFCIRGPRNVLLPIWLQNIDTKTFKQSEP